MEGLIPVAVAICAIVGFFTIWLWLAQAHKEIKQVQEERRLELNAREEWRQVNEEASTHWNLVDDEWVWDRHDGKDVVDQKWMKVEDIPIEKHQKSWKHWSVVDGRWVWDRHDGKDVVDGKWVKLTDQSTT